MDGTSAHWLLTGCKVQSDKRLLSGRLHAEKVETKVEIGLHASP